MFRSLALISVLATAAAASAQSTDAAATGSASPPPTSAPIVRAYQSNPPQAQSTPDPDQDSAPSGTRAPMARRSRRPNEDRSQLIDSQPITGVWLRSNAASVVHTVSATPQGTEIRLEKGVLNVSVHQPAAHSAIFVNLPGGQTSLLKDGLYTFNADTNTVRVLHGEAAAFPSTQQPGLTPVAITNTPHDKGIKIKEAHQFSFLPTLNTGERLKSTEAYPYEIAADLLPTGNGDGRGYANYSGDDGPYYAGAWGYPGYYSGYYPGYWGFGYPYGYGIGIGYYGGYRGGFGGYRGSFGGYRGGIGGFRGGATGGGHR